jgi:hypothetical protein
MLRLLALALGVAIAACAPPPAPSIPTGSAAELSFDGLHRVQNARFAGVWVRKGADLSVYRRLMILPPEIAYKKPPSPRGDPEAGFPLDEHQMGKLRQLFRDVFREELLAGDCQLSEAPGPDVLLVQAGLLDLVVRVPTSGLHSARGGTWVSSYGVMTLVVQLYDSETRQILARVMERREVLPAAAVEFSKAELSTSIELRTFFERWATRLREGLDAARARTP